MKVPRQTSGKSLKKGVANQCANNVDSNAAPWSGGKEHSGQGPVRSSTNSASSPKRSYGSE